MFDQTYQEYKDELKKYAALGVWDAALDLGYKDDVLQSKFVYEHIWNSMMMRDEVSVRAAESVDIKHLEEHDIVIRDGVVMFKEGAVLNCPACTNLVTLYLYSRIKSGDVKPRKGACQSCNRPYSAFVD
ncbi:hypothetical protein [Brevibacillus laterosporus]|uniref:hypothetical protein n=1 Tax=Brevibacillus laterosporus TaxID=1465 RepID=UPI003D23F668